MTNTWYVLQCKPQKEDVVYKQLCTREIETFYPKVRTKSTHSHKFRFKPYFPGYLFICFDVNQHSELKWLPGTIDLVSFGGEPASVPYSIIHTIRQKVNEINAIGSAMIENQYLPGDNVTIRSGLLDGCKAIFDSHLSDTQRVRVFLECLHQQIMVNLPAEYIRA